jgi:peptidyl-prolyl cis-trans isomerase C
MKFNLVLLCLILLSPVSGFTQAADLQPDEEVLAQRGNGIVYQSTMDARLKKAPEEYRHRTLADVDRLREIINTLLINAQLAADAREAGFDSEQVVVSRMKLAAETELAQAWLQHYVEAKPDGNYEQLAREYFLANQEEFVFPPRVDVSHILISTRERSEEKAKELADTLSVQLEEKPELFAQFVIEFSEDPSASSNKGQFTAVKKGDMVKEFEDTAFSMEEGEISPPVKTNFGYHIIRLDSYKGPVKKSFDEVKSQLIDLQRQQHEDRIKQDYLSRLTSLDVNMSKEALDEMFKRQLGESFTQSPDSEPETE